MLAALLAATLPWVGWLGNAAGASRGLRRSAVAPRVAGTLRAGVRGFVPPKLNMTRPVRSSTAQEPRHAHKAVRMSPWTAARAAWTSNSFHEFMVYMRAHQGDILELETMANRCLLNLNKHPNKQICICMLRAQIFVMAIGNMMGRFARKAGVGLTGTQR